MDNTLTTRVNEHTDLKKKKHENTNDKYCLM